MGVVFKLRMIALSPQVVATENAQKGAMIWRISKNALTYPKEKIGVLTTSNSDLLQFVYRICSHSTPRLLYTLSIGSRRKGGKFAMLLKNLNVFYSLPQLVANETRQKGQDF